MPGACVVKKMYGDDQYTPPVFSAPWYQTRSRGSKSSCGLMVRSTAWPAASRCTEDTWRAPGRLTISLVSVPPAGLRRTMVKSPSPVPT